MSAQMQSPSQETPQLQHALYYASLGWSVVPSHKVVRLPDGGTACTCPAGSACISKGKHPAVSWTHWQRERATDVQIRSWFTGHYETYGVGIITGAVSGMFVIDVDEGPGKQGGETLLNIQMIHGDLPHTVQARTGGGGRHMVFRHPRDVWITTGKNVLGPGIDIRGDGGFIVAAPSIHESGRFYLWDETAHPRTTPMAEAPAWVVEMAETPPPDPSGQRKPATGTGEIVRDAWGRVTDGRERHMIGIVCGVIATHLRDCGLLPSVEETVAEAWPSYERTTRARGVSLEEDGRGMALMRQRAGHMLARAASGKWRIAAEPRPFGGGEAGTEEQKAPPQKATPGKRARPGLLHLREVESRPPPEWLVHGLFPAKSLIVPYGPPKGGKTFMMLSLCLHIAAGKEWFGCAVKAGAVVYIAGEGIGGLGIRTRAMRAHYGITDDIPFFILPRAVNLTEPDAAAWLVAAVRKAIPVGPIALVVIDTLARAMPGAEENSAKDVGLVIAACDEIKEDLDCAVVPITHQGKEESRGIRGTSAIRGAVDASFKISGLSKTSRVVTMVNEDQKEAEPADDMVFEMVAVSVGLSRSGLVPVLRMPPIVPDEGAQSSRNEIGGQAGIALRILRDILSGPESAIIPPFNGAPSGTIRGTDASVWRRCFYEKMPTLEVKARQKAFQRAVETLTERNFIGAHDPWVWLS